MLRKYSVRGWVAVVSVWLVCAAALCEPVKSLPKPTDYVSDFAHVMSPAAQRQLNLLCGQVDRQAHAQIAVVTVQTTDDVPIQQYAVELEDAWGVGKHLDRGVIVLLAVNDRKRFIETGYGLESILPDSKVGEIGRQMVPMLRNNDFDGAVSLAVGEMSQIIAKDAGVTLTAQQRRGGPQQVHLSLGQVIIFGIFALIFIVFLIRSGGSGIIGFLLGMFLGGGGRGGFGGGGGGGGDGDGGGSGFGGFGGGNTGGGGAGGDW